MYRNTNLARSKQKSIGWNKLRLNVFAQLKEKRLFKMAKDPSEQTENQSFGHKTALHIITILQVHVPCRKLSSHFTTKIITSCMKSRFCHHYFNILVFLCDCYDCLGTLQTVVILASCMASTIWGHFQICTVGITWCWLALGERAGEAPPPPMALTNTSVDNLIRVVF